MLRFSSRLLLHWFRPSVTNGRRPAFAKCAPLSVPASGSLTVELQALNFTTYMADNDENKDMDTGNDQDKDYGDTSAEDTDKGADETAARNDDSN